MRILGSTPRTLIFMCKFIMVAGSYVKNFVATGEPDSRSNRLDEAAG